VSSKRSTEDSDLFEEAMAGVRPLQRNKAVPRVLLRTPVPPSERDREVLRALDQLIEGEDPVPLHETDEYVEGAVPGLDPRVVRRMRKGEFKAQADLDLHGLVSETARKLVQRFIAESQARGLRCVRIVHGRGRNSPGGVPVLKSSLPRWLSRGHARRSVLAYTSAPPRDGGAGATYVLLRKGAAARRPSGKPL
jgi:DNA-nicking Smr family endonuclease